MASPGELMAAAVEKTGLDDFGDDSFREGLEILVKALRDEARLNDRGEGFLYPRIIGTHPRQRLQIEDWYRRHPEIDEVPIDAPLIGLGLPRTGFDRVVVPARAGSRHPLSAQVGIGAHRARRRRRCEGDDPRIPPRVRVDAGSRHHVPVRHPRPDRVPRPDGARLQVADLPRVRADPVVLADGSLDKADLTSTYLYERRVLKLLAWGEPTRPWRLKSPAHMMSLRLPRPRLPRCPLRDDPPRPDRRDRSLSPTSTPTSSAASPTTSIGRTSASSTSSSGRSAWSAR